MSAAVGQLPRLTETLCQNHFSAPSLYLIHLMILVGANNNPKQDITWY